MSKKRTKGFTIKRATYIARKLRERYNSACSVEVVIWSWIAKEKEELKFGIYDSKELLTFSSWIELEDRFAELISESKGSKGEKE